jgi:hypothetical protein
MSDAPDSFNALHSVWNTILTGVATVTGWAIKRQVDRIDVLLTAVQFTYPIS